MRTLVGLVPAAGQAKRISPLPCSKELFPVGFHDLTVHGIPREQPKVVSQYLLENMALAGAKKIYLIINKSKTDILQYYGTGAQLGLSIAYLIVENLGGMPYTLNQAEPWLEEETILFGMPDSIIEPQEVYVHLLEHHWSGSFDLTLGLFLTDTPQCFGMVAMGLDRQVLYIVDKPQDSDLHYMWGVACWSPQFTSFLAYYLSTLNSDVNEVVLGDVFQAAIEHGLRVGSVPFDRGSYLDIGTSQGLKRAIQRFNS